MAFVAARIGAALVVYVALPLLAYLLLVRIAERNNLR